MPAPLRAFAGHQPFTPVVDTMRGLWMGHTISSATTSHQLWLALAYCAGTLAISLPAATWLFPHHAAA